jgi:hypothetical protein
MSWFVVLIDFPEKKRGCFCRSVKTKKQEELLGENRMNAINSPRVFCVLWQRVNLIALSKYVADAIQVIKLLNMILL